MKIAKIVLGILTVISIGLLVLVSINGDDTVYAVGPVKDNIIEAVCLILAPFFLVVICILSLVEKVAVGSTGRGLMIAGIIIFGSVTAGLGKLVYDSRDDFKLIKKLESPDGEHMIYYYETTLQHRYSDETVPGIVTLRRTGIFTYEKGALCADDEKDMIIWEEDYYKPYVGKEKFEYSSYGKK